MTFLRDVKGQERKIELVTLNLDADEKGLQSAQAQFHIWTDTSNETITTK